MYNKTKEEDVHELREIKEIDLNDSEDEDSIIIHSEPSRSKLFTFLATICMAGIQFIWTVELSRGTSYLKRLNLPDKITALVWLAGLITQPVVGALSDKCTCKIGKRRPFIIVGSILVCITMLGVAFSKEIGGDSSSTFDIHGDEKRRYKDSTLAIAILSFYILDFSLNAVSATCRSLIIDVHPLHQQERANAFAGNISSITNVIGYAIGSLDLVHYVPIVDPNDEDGQLKIFCFISIVVFCITVTITCLFVKEEQGMQQPKRPVFKYIFQAVRRLPKSIQKLCFVQFFTSMSWFPFLFYSSAWVTGINNQSILSQQQHNNNLTPKELDQSDRVGSFALLLNSAVAVLIGIVFPLIVSKQWISLKTVFTFSIGVLAIVLLCTFFVHQVSTAYIILAMLGIPWACAHWIPFSLIGKYLEIEKQRHHDTIGASSQLLLETGMVVGVHNIYVVIPQFIVAFISSLIFTAVHKNEQLQDNNKQSIAGIAWVLQFGGLMAIIATIISRWIDKV